jgi:N-sulfoglucosamine sulfohydrolase
MISRAHPGRPDRLVGVSLTVAITIATVATTAAAQTRSPNIVWLSAEDMGSRLGAYGDPIARTPHLDRLADEGVRYDHAYVPQPICAPARTAIITGMYQNAIGAQHMRTTESGMEGSPGPYLAVPPHYARAFPEYLRAAGYYTSNNVKTDYQFGLPFTIWDESSAQAHWRNRPDPDQPFFAVFNNVGTHESQVWPHTARNQERPLVTDPASVQVPPYYPDTPAVRESLARHYDNIAEMDTWAGDLLRQLEDDGLLDNTVVFFWGDHGDGLPRAKRWLYDSGLRVPLIVRWPDGLDRGTASEELVSLIDLAPTVLALAGVEVPRHMHGRVIAGPGREPAPDYLFATRDRVDVAYDMVRAAWDGRFRYIRNFYPELPYVLHVPYRNQTPIMQELLRLHEEDLLSGPQRLWLADRRPAEELYDTRADPHEIHNLAGDPAHRQVLERFRGTLDGWMAAIGDLGLISEAEMVQRMWPGGVQPATARPYVIPRRSSERELRHVGRIQLEGPGEIVLYSPTQGASIGFTTEEGADARWRLYSGPIRVDRTMTIRVRAIRYGYQESEEVVVTVDVP